MASKTFLLKDAAASGSSAGQLQDGGAISAAATTTIFGFPADTTACDVRQSYAVNNTALSTFHTEPSTAPAGSAKDSWRTVGLHDDGTYAAGAWSFSIGVDDSSDFGAGCSFQIAFRLWKSVNANGTGATEITSGIVRGSLVSDAASGVFTLTATSGGLAGVTFSSEYLFLEVAASCDGAGFVSSANPLTVHVGTTLSFLATPDFTPAGPPAPPTTWLLNESAPVPVAQQFATPATEVPWGTLWSPDLFLATVSDGSATAPAAPGIANFTSGAGEATGAALVGAAPGTAAFASPAGKATGAARAAGAPGAATFSSAPGAASAGVPAVAPAAPGIASFSSPAGKAAVASAGGGGGVFGPGLVGVYRPQPQKPPPRPEPVSRPAKAFAAPGQIFTTSAPGSAFVTRPAVAPAVPGELRFDAPLGRAVGARSARPMGFAGEAAFASPAGAARGSARAPAQAVAAAFAGSSGTAKGDAAARTRAVETAASASPGGAVGGHNPSDAELAALALLLDDDFLEDAA